ncbi:MAG: haloacid dehalogenase type II [Mycobacterium leprae]
MPRLIVFDSYVTLFQLKPLERLAEALYPGAGHGLAGLWQQKKLEYAWVRSMNHRYDDFWTIAEEALAVAARTLRLPLSHTARTQLMRAQLALPAYPDVAPAMLQLHERGVPLAILSQGTPAMLRPLVQRNRLDTLVSAILSADLAKSYKPCLAAYRLVQDRLGVLPAEALFVTAHGWDISGAAAAGFGTAWIQREGQPFDQLGVEPDLELEELTELIDQVK